MSNKKNVAVIGAGPAGIYAAKQLVSDGFNVVLVNRDIKPGGLAEYGIFFDKYKMKNGLRRQFRRIMELDELHYLGNVTVGQDGHVTFQELCELGFDAVLVTVGAQGTKWLGLPGESLRGVYHAKDLVYHYNHLPPFAELGFAIGERVAVIGAGNVMLDMANWLIRYRKVEEFIAVVRRDPSAVKFDKKEMQIVAANLDIEALDAEIERTRPIMEAVGNDPEAAREFILSALPRAKPKVSDTRFRFEFLAQPQAIEDDGHGNVGGLTVEDTTLVLRDGGRTSARGLGTTRTLDVDTVIFAIGDTVDSGFGLPLDRWQDFAKHPEPRYPVNDTSYEAYDPTTGEPVEGVFVAGWAREASTGLVGAARKDGTSAASAIAAYLAEKPASDDDPIAALAALVAARTRVVDKADIARLEAIEDARAAADGVEEFKFDANEAMLAALAE